MTYLWLTLVLLDLLLVSCVFDEVRPPVVDDRVLLFVRYVVPLEAEATVDRKEKTVEESMWRQSYTICQREEYHLRSVIRYVLPVFGKIDAGPWAIGAADGEFALFSPVHACRIVTSSCSFEHFEVFPLSHGAGERFVAVLQMN